MMLSQPFALGNHLATFLLTAPREAETMACAEHQDITSLDDPELLAERRRVRDELEAHPTRALAERYKRLDEEFIRRARTAWSRAKP